MVTMGPDRTAFLREAQSKPDVDTSDKPTTEPTLTGLWMRMKAISAAVEEVGMTAQAAATVTEQSMSLMQKVMSAREAEFRDFMSQVVAGRTGLQDWIRAYLEALEFIEKGRKAGRIVDDSRLQQMENLLRQFGLNNLSDVRKFGPDWLKEQQKGRMS
jgi:hypothetical protein